MEREFTVAEAAHVERIRGLVGEMHQHLKDAVTAHEKGAAKDDRLEIAIELEDNAGTLVARIEDNGLPFDPTQVRSPPLATSLEQAKVGDLGIHLIRSFASG